MTHTLPGSTTIEHAWQFDALNRVTDYDNSIDDVTAYSYDGQSQLTGADGAVDGDYEYDPNGNRIATGGTTSEVGPGNRLTSDGTYDYTYDAEGNLTRRVKEINGDQLDFSYDYRNRLTKIVESFGDLDDPLLAINYRYDIFDRLVWRDQTDYHHADGGEGGTGQVTTTVSVERRFYDGDHVVLDFIQDGWGEPIELRHRYLYGPAVDQVLAQEDVPNSHDPYLATIRPLWLLTDNQGTVRDIVNNAGGTITGGHFKYDAYGQILSGDSDKTLTRYLYTGRDFDATTGLQYNRARWYDSFTGRWTTQDPSGFAAGDANLYRYVGNSPTNATDPSGLSASQCCGVTIDSITLNRVTVTFTNLAGKDFSANAQLPGVTDISKGILKGILNVILKSIDVSGVGKILFAQFIGIEKASDLTFTSVRAEADVTVALSIKMCDNSIQKKSQDLTIALGRINLSYIQGNDKTGFAQALNQIKAKIKDNLQHLNNLVTAEVGKLYKCGVSSPK